MGAQQNVVFIASSFDRGDVGDRKKRRKSAIDREKRYWGGKRVTDQRSLLGLSVLRAKKRDRRARKSANYERADSAQYATTTSLETAHN